MGELTQSAGTDLSSCPRESSILHVQKHPLPVWNVRKLRYSIPVSLHFSKIRSLKKVKKEFQRENISPEIKESKCLTIVSDDGRYIERKEKKFDNPFPHSMNIC